MCKEANTRVGIWNVYFSRLISRQSTPFWACSEMEIYDYVVHFSGSRQILEEWSTSFQINSAYKSTER